MTICHPLKYSIIISHWVLQSFGWGPWRWEGLWHPWSTWLMPCTFPSVAPESSTTFCEVKALMKLSCEDISAYEKGLVVTSIVEVLLPTSLILTSYTLIFLQVLQMNSPRRQERGPGYYSSPSYSAHILLCPSHANMHEAWIFSHLCSEPGSLLFDTILTPMLNPLIYSLRNREVVGSIRKMLRM